MESNFWFTTQHTTTRYHRPTYHISLLSVPRVVFCITGLLLYLLIFIIHDTTASRWQQGVVPIFRVDLSQLSDVKNFKPLGQTNNFKAIYVHGDNLLVGSQNALFNLSLPDLRELKVSVVFSFVYFIQCILVYRKKKNLSAYLHVLVCERLFKELFFSSFFSPFHVYLIFLLKSYFDVYVCTKWVSHVIFPSM